VRFVALATDYDGTLASDGRVSDATLAALRNFRQSGRKVILVTGRVLSDLETVFSNFELFDWVVAENGAVLYNPSTREKHVLAPPPSAALVDALRRRGVQPLETGDAIVATQRPHETVVLQAIRDLGLEMQVIFNKSAVMVLPSGVNKRTGLAAALEPMTLSEHEVVGVGDAENDHAFLRACECAVAVANAHPAIKEEADYTTQADDGAGVAELIDLILANQLAGRVASHSVPLGREGEREVSIPAFGSSLLVTGASASGKSTFIAGLLEVLIARRYQLCVIDPEGDYENLANTITLGDERHPPSAEAVMQTLQKPSSSVVVNLIGVQLTERPAFFESLLPRLQEMRLRTGRPHWIVADEAHHLIGSDWAPASPELATQLQNLILVTVHPDHVSPVALQAVDAVAAIGEHADEAIREFAKGRGIEGPPVEGSLESGQVFIWFPGTGDLRRVDIHLAHADRQRHKRKYSHGDLGEDRSFYFRGPKNKLNLRANNLMMFLQIADGVDDDTWLHHLRRGDYSRWMRERIKDDDLAGEIAQYENGSLGPRLSRERIKAAIEQRYTAPA
jgi:HAD superfamily hydrolase (TIGR01484 family)